MVVRRKPTPPNPNPPAGEAITPEVMVAQLGGSEALGRERDARAGFQKIAVGGHQWHTEVRGGNGELCIVGSKFSRRGHIEHVVAGRRVPPAPATRAPR